MSGSLLGSAARRGHASSSWCSPPLLAFVAYRAARRRATSGRPSWPPPWWWSSTWSGWSQGPGFVPGLVATTPFAAAGLVLAWKRPLGHGWRP